jgi:hypothetical protein
MQGFVPGRSRNSSMQPIFEEIEKLEVLLGFRHRERNTCTAGLAEGRMPEIAGGIADAMNAVRADLTRFERAMTATPGDTQRPGKQATASRSRDRYGPSGRRGPWL